MDYFRLFSSIPIEKEHKVWAEIDINALRANYRVLRDFVRRNNPDETVICVIKADAYGHGAKACCRALVSEGAGHFAVSCVEEGIDVRTVCDEAAKDAEILVMGYTFPSQAEIMAKYRLTATLADYNHSLLLADAAKAADIVLTCHIKIDTGMNRLGFPAMSNADTEAAAEHICEITKNPHLNITGIFTHFAKADEEHRTDTENMTSLQYGRFMKLSEKLQEFGCDIKFKHACNSAGALMFPDYGLSACRMGILLYGGCPTEHFPDLTLSPVMKFKTIISHIHTLPPGETVSYGGIFSSDIPRTVATIPVGYADGFIRAYSGALVSVTTKSGTERVPVVGRICMDQCMLDITGTDITVGDEVTLFGNSQDDLRSLAIRAGSIDYEVLCLVSARVVRKIIG